MSIVGVLVMTKKSCIDTERDIGEMWKQALQQSMLEAGRSVREYVWPSSLAKRLERFFILESATSFVMQAQRRFQRKTTLTTGI